MNGMLKQVAEYLERHLKESRRFDFEVRYRYEHSIRVANIGIEIAKEENADIIVVALSGLLHDYGKFDTEKNVEHGRVSAKMVRPFLETLNIEDSQIELICQSIASHCDGCGENLEEIDTLEAKILRDADRIDRFGFNKVFLRRFLDHQKALTDANNQMELTRRRIHILESLISEDRMSTELGKTMLEKRVNFQVQFYKRYLRELELSNLLELDDEF